MRLPMDKFDNIFESIMERKALNMNNYKKAMGKIRDAYKGNNGLSLSADEVEALAISMKATTRYESEEHPKE
jgi:hypothetical protein